MTISESKFRHTESTDAIWIWTLAATVKTRFGPIGVSAITNPDARPDTEMASLAQKLIDFADNNSENLVSTVFACYREASAHDPNWLTHEGVPLNINRQDILKFLVPPHEVVVTRHRLTRDEVRAKFLLNPKWDKEHGLSITLVDDKIHAVNNSTDFRRYL